MSRIRMLKRLREVESDISWTGEGSSRDGARLSPEFRDLSPELQNYRKADARKAPFGKFMKVPRA
jgi:hypothetical protein